MTPSITALCGYTVCRNAPRHILLIANMNVIMLVIMLSVAMLNVIMLSVAGPKMGMLL
jgi:hypothetical protein